MRGRAALAVVAASAAALGAVLPRPAPASAGATETLVTPADNNTEPSLAVNPTNAQDLVIGYMHKPSGLDTHGGVATSLDGGATWTTQDLAFAGTGESTFADADVVFDSAGTAYMSGIAFNHSFEVGSVKVARSGDGGRTWSTPSVAIDGTENAPSNGYDRPWLATGPTPGTLYLISQSIFTNDVGAVLSHEYFRASADGGATWGPLRTIDTAADPADTLPEGTISVAPDGTVAVAYNASSVPEGMQCTCIVVATSTDGGADFTYHTVLTATQPNYGIDVPDQGQPDVYRFALAPTVVADPAVNGRLAIARLTFPGTVPYYLEKQGTVQAQVFLSNDAGASWSSPVVVAQAPTISADRVWPAYNAAGALGVSIRSREGSCCSSDYEIWSAVAPAGDLGFGAPFEMSSVASPSGGAATGVGDDFIGAAVDAQNIESAWMDQRNGSKQIYFARTALP